MKPIIQHHNLQQLISGDSLHITSYQFQSNTYGPRVYLQANLHGSEIFGSVLLIQLIAYLKNTHLLKGSVTIVPQANPISVQSQTYGNISGRWNEQTGNNWNRIFSKSITESTDVNIEKTLANLLATLATHHTHILDIHTSGKDGVSHLYTHAEAIDCFSALQPTHIITYNEQDYCHAFDESLWLQEKEQGRTVYGATWEASSHGNLDRTELKNRFQDLIHFLTTLGMLDVEHTQSSISQIVSLSQIKKLFAPGAGYLVWKCETGTRVQTQEVYTELYEPWSGNVKELRAGKSFTLLSKNTLQAVSSGQEIGKCILW